MASRAAYLQHLQSIAVPPAATGVASPNVPAPLSTTDKSRVASVVPSWKQKQLSPSNPNQQNGGLPTPNQPSRSAPKWKTQSNPPTSSSVLNQSAPKWKTQANPSTPSSIVDQLSQQRTPAPISTYRNPNPAWKTKGTSTVNTWIPPPPPPPPPAPETPSSFKTPVKDNTQSKRFPAVVSPETPFAVSPSPLASSKRNYGVSPQSPRPIEPQNYSSVDYHVPQGDGSSVRDKRFSFFQATTPRKLANPSLADKISPYRSSDPSDGTQTTWNSESEDEEGEHDQSPVARKSLVDTWQERVQRNSSSLQPQQLSGAHLHAQKLPGTPLKPYQRSVTPLKSVVTPSSAVLPKHPVQAERKDDKYEIPAKVMPVVKVPKHQQILKQTEGGVENSPSILGISPRPIFDEKEFETETQTIVRVTGSNSVAAKWQQRLQQSHSGEESGTSSSARQSNETSATPSLVRAAGPGSRGVAAKWQQRMQPTLQEGDEESDRSAVSSPRVSKGKQFNQKIQEFAGEEETFSFNEFGANLEGAIQQEQDDGEKYSSSSSPVLGSKWQQNIQQRQEDKDADIHSASHYSDSTVFATKLQQDIQQNLEDKDADIQNTSRLSESNVLAAKLQQNIQQHLEDEDGDIQSPLRFSDSNVLAAKLQQHLEDEEQEEISSSASSDSVYSAPPVKREHTFLETSGDNEEEEEKQDPLRVIGSNAVAAKWQQSIRQTQGKLRLNRSNSSGRAAPSTSPLDKQKAGESFMNTKPVPSLNDISPSMDSIEQTYGDSTQGTRENESHTTFFAPQRAFNMLGDFWQPDTSSSSQRVAQQFSQGEPSPTGHSQLFLAPFSPKEDEKKDDDDHFAMVPVPHEEPDFDDVFNTLALTVGAARLEDDGVLVRNYNFDFLMEMIDDCESRWEDSSKVSTPRAHLNYLAAAPHEETEQERLIRLQQEEIAELRGKLISKEMRLVSPSARSTAPSERVLPSNSSVAVASNMSSVAPLEAIDSVPFEHFEVAVVDDPDLCSVTSGLTNLNDLFRGPFESELATAKSNSPEPFGHTPRFPVDRVASSSAHIVRCVPVRLQAADGSSKRALYTGPVTLRGEYTGLGHFTFEDTGDVYNGEVRNGKMHGHGSYTYARRSRKSKNRPAKVLRGTFEDNVFTGWDPAISTK